MPQFEHFLEIAETLKRTTENPILEQGPLNIWTEYLVAQILSFFLTYYRFWPLTTISD